MAMTVEQAISQGYKPTCGIAYCWDTATYQVEVSGFAKQYMCKRHADLTYRSIKSDYFFGMEELD